MADLDDVMAALATLAAAAVFPSGPSQPSVTGACIKIYPGWPIQQQLDADLAAGICNISVYPRPEERNTTRYPEEWQDLTVNSPTLSLTVVGQTVVIDGTIPPPANPHNAVIFANAKPYVYAVQSTDALSDVAHALAALIAADIPGAAAAGVIVTLPPFARGIIARVGITGTAIKEIRRQERLFQITIWADSPAHRTAIAKPLDVALADLRRITLIDGTSARLIYKSSPMSDLYEKSGLFRRDLYYTVEYATTVIETETQITQIQIDIATHLGDGVSVDSTEITMDSTQVTMDSAPSDIAVTLFE